jgi:endonuclease/exonuclease/phosphatase family metal-dependent hydrolase
MTALLSLLGALVVLAQPIHASADASATIRLVTFNLLHGGATSGISGNDQALDRRLAIVARDLRALDPDVVALQESSIGRRRGNVAARLAAQLSLQYVYTTTTSRVTPLTIVNRLAAWLMDFSEGPAILSRFPIVASEVYDLPPCAKWLDPRVMLRAEVATPAGALQVFSAHTSRDDCQLRRVGEVVARARGALPALVMGDFNSSEASSAIVSLTRQTRLVDAFRVVNPDTAGPTVWQRIDATAATAMRRVDYVFMVPGARVEGAVQASRVVLDVPERRADGSVLWPSDHYGVFAEIRLVDRATR